MSLHDNNATIMQINALLMHCLHTMLSFVHEIGNYKYIVVR